MRVAIVARPGVGAGPSVAEGLHRLLVRAGAEHVHPDAAEVVVAVDAPVPTATPAVSVLAGEVEPLPGTWRRILCLSGAHAAWLQARHGIQSTALPVPVSALEAPPEPRDRLLFTSHPSRGLGRLLRIWPGIHEACGLPLAIGHDVRDFVETRDRAIGPLLDQPGVVVYGPLDAAALARARAMSRALLVPPCPAPYDVLASTSAFEAAAVGLPVVAARGAALPAHTPVDDPDSPEAWAAAIRFATSPPPPDADPRAWWNAITGDTDPVTVPEPARTERHWRPPRLVP